MSHLAAGDVAVITGGSSGIGQAIASTLVSLGLRVVIASDNQEALRRAAGELSAVGRTVEPIRCHVRSRAAVGQLARDVLSLYGREDLLVNNAGYAEYRSF